MQICREQQILNSKESMKPLTAKRSHVLSSVYDELVNTGDVLPGALWYKSLDTFTMPAVEEDPMGNMLDKFADFMSINANAAKETDYNFCVTCGVACIMTNNGYECPNCGVVKHAVGDFKDVHDESMKIINYGGRKLYSIVDYSKTQKKNVLGQLLQLNDNKPTKYTRGEFVTGAVTLVTPVAVPIAPIVPCFKKDNIPEDIDLPLETSAVVTNTTEVSNDEKPEPFNAESCEVIAEKSVKKSTDLSADLSPKSTADLSPESTDFSADSSHNNSFESSANSTINSINTPIYFSSTDSSARRQTVVNICESTLVSATTTLQEPSIRFPKVILEKAADYYNMIQKVTIDQVDAEGKICGQKHIVRRGDVKDEVIGYCIYCACVEMGMPRKEKEIAKFMRIKNNGLSRGKNFVRKLYCAGKINIPALDIDANDYYVKRYLTSLKLYADDQSPQNSIFGSLPSAGIFGIYKNYLDVNSGVYNYNYNCSYTSDYNERENQSSNYQNNNRFVLKLVEEATRLGVGNNSNHISKIVGSIWVLICHLDLAADETPTRKKSEKQKPRAGISATTQGKFSYDKMYSRQMTPLIMNYEQAMAFAELHRAEIIWPGDSCGETYLEDNASNMQFVAIFTGLKHIVIGRERSSLFKSEAFGRQINDLEQNDIKNQQNDLSLQPDMTPNSSKSSRTPNSSQSTPNRSKAGISLADLENACDGIRKNTFLKFSKCIEDNILLFIDVFNEFGIPHKVKGKLIKRKKNINERQNIIEQLYGL